MFAIDKVAEHAGGGAKFVQCRGELEFAFLADVVFNLASKDVEEFRRQDILTIDAEELVWWEIVKRKVLAGVFKRWFFREFRQLDDGVFGIGPSASGGAVMVDHVSRSRIEGDDGVATALVEGFDELCRTGFFRVGTVEMVSEEQ